MPDAALSTPQWVGICFSHIIHVIRVISPTMQTRDRNRDSVTTPGPKMTEPGFEPMSDAAVTACNRIVGFVVSFMVDKCQAGPDLGLINYPFFSLLSLPSRKEQ